MTDDPGTVSFRVIGTPQPRGSKSRLPGLPDSNPRSKDWMALVIAAADGIRNGQPPLTGPLAVHIDFTFARPSSHYGQGRNADKIRPSARTYPPPDVDKLARGTIDALTGLLWRDDRQIVALKLRKQYGYPAGAQITVTAASARFSIEQTLDRYRQALVRVADANSGVWGDIAAQALHPERSPPAARSAAH